MVKVLVDELGAGYSEALQEQIEHYVNAQAEIQKVVSPSGNLESGSGLGEPKYHVDGRPTWADWGLLIAMGLTGGTGQYFMTKAFGLAKAAVISPFNYVGLLWAAIFGWVIWGDIPATHVFVGSAVVVASGLFILYREVRKDPEAAPPNT